MPGNPLIFSGSRGAGPETAQGELLDVRAVAVLLSVSRRTVYRLSETGRMPRPRKLNVLVRWSRSQVLEWIAAGCPSVSRLPDDCSHPQRGMGRHANRHARKAGAS